MVELQWRNKNPRKLFWPGAQQSGLGAILGLRVGQVSQERLGDEKVLTRKGLLEQRKQIN